MWRLLNHLFGYDYVKDVRDSKRRVRRIYACGRGHQGKWCIKPHLYLDDPKFYVWLTCSPHKYFPPED